MTSDERGLPGSPGLLAEAMRQVFAEATEKTDDPSQHQEPVTDDVRNALKGD